MSEMSEECAEGDCQHCAMWPCCEEDIQPCNLRVPRRGRDRTPAGARFAMTPVFSSDRDGLELRGWIDTAAVELNCEFVTFPLLSPLPPAWSPEDPP